MSKTRAIVAKQSLLLRLGKLDIRVTGCASQPLFLRPFPSKLAVMIMQTRRSIFKTCGQLAASLACLPWVLFAASESQAGVPRGPLLEERLLVGLRVKTAADRQFIRRVVLLVRRGVLPVRLVDSTFFWARAKASRKRALSNNPMVYFRPALVARARALRIRI